MQGKSILIGSVRWTGGLAVDAGRLRYRSRYGDGITPAVVWTPTGDDLTLIERTWALPPGEARAVDLSADPSVTESPAAMTQVVGLEAVVLTPQASIRLGPQGLADAAQLFFGGTGPDHWLSVHQAWSWLAPVEQGVPVQTPNSRLWIYNPMTRPVHVWLRITGMRGE